MSPRQMSTGPLQRVPARTAVTENKGTRTVPRDQVGAPRHQYSQRSNLTRICCRYSETYCAIALETVYSSNVRANPPRGGDAKPPISSYSLLARDSGVAGTCCITWVPSFLVRTAVVCLALAVGSGIARYGSLDLRHRPLLAIGPVGIDRSAHRRGVRQRGCQRSLDDQQ